MPMSKHRTGDRRRDRRQVGAGWAIGLDAATYAASAFFLVGLHVNESRRQRPKNTFLTDLAAGWSEFRSRRWLLALVAEFRPVRGQRAPVAGARRNRQCPADLARRLFRRCERIRRRRRLGNHLAGAHPPEALSRVSSYDWLGSMAFLPLGYALTGPFAAWLGTETVLVGAAVQIASAPLLLCVSSIRDIRRRSADLATPAVAEPPGSGVVGTKGVES
jgi:hypothetical protein